MDEDENFFDSSPRHRAKGYEPAANTSLIRCLLSQNFARDSPVSKEQFHEVFIDTSLIIVDTLGGEEPVSRCCLPSNCSPEPKIDQQQCSIPSVAPQPHAILPYLIGASQDLTSLS